MNNPHGQGYWFVLREDQSNVLISSSNNSFTIHNPQVSGQEPRFIVDSGERQFVQINEAPVVAPEVTAPVDADEKKELFWDRNRIKVLLTLCLENNFKNPTKDKIILEQIAEHLGTSPDECSAKYKNLRRTFIRLLKKRRYGKEIKWVHYSICEKVFNECKSLPASVLEPWDDDRVRNLLNLYIDNLGRFRSSECLHKDVWRAIAMQLGTTDYNCYHKYKNLKRAHFKWMQRSRETSKPSKWPYHHYFERIFFEFNPVKGPWDRNKTKQLLNAYVQIVHKFRSPRYQKKDLWKEISLVVGVSPSNCDKKFRNMKQTYLKLKSKSDAGRAITKWRYYKDFDAIFNPMFRCECGPVITHRNEDYVKQLLEFYLENKDKFRDQRIKKKSVWRELATTIGLSPDECDRKFRNLKQTYVRLVERTNMTDKISNWPYFEYFDKIFNSKQRRHTPQFCADEVPQGDMSAALVRRHYEQDNFHKLFRAMDQSNDIQRERNRILEKNLKNNLMALSDTAQTCKPPAMRFTT